MKIYITDKDAWKKHPTKKQYLNFKDQTYAGFKPYKDGYLGYDDLEPDELFGYTCLKDELLKIDSDLDITLIEPYESYGDICEAK